MSDDADLADEVIEILVDLGVAKILKKLEPSGVTECVDCPDEIPAIRREAVPSATRCVDCQEILEAKARHLA